MDLVGRHYWQTAGKRDYTPNIRNPGHRYDQHSDVRARNSILK
jgi:hypothetical protein